MPVTYVNIEWPNQEFDKVYSPSSVIKEYFTEGDSLSVEEFLTKCNNALYEASERVKKKYGYACTTAQEELKRINEKCKDFHFLKNVKIISIK